MRARWLKIVNAIPYTMDGPGGKPLKSSMLPACELGFCDGRIGESFVTMAVGRKGLEALLASGDLVDLGKTYDAPAQEPAAFFRYAWPDESK